MQVCAPSLVDAMCELPAEPSSDTSHQNIFNVVLDIVTSYQLGERLEMHLTGEEIGRVGLCCLFSLDSRCENLFCVFFFCLSH